MFGQDDETQETGRGRAKTGHRTIFESMDIGHAPPMHAPGSDKLEIGHGLGREIQERKGRNHKPSILD